MSLVGWLIVADSWDLLPVCRTGMVADGSRRTCSSALQVNLRWASVDFDRLVLTAEGRNAKSRQTRHAPLNEETAVTLRSWRSSRETAQTF